GKEMIQNKSNLANASGEAATRISRRVDELLAEQKKFETTIASYNDKMKGMENLMINLKDYESPDMTRKAFQCEDKNKKCVKLNTKVTSTLEKNHSVGVGVTYQDFGLDVNVAGGKKTGNGDEHERLECWNTDECAKILAKHYEDDQKRVHEMRLKTIELKEQRDKENDAARRKHIEDRFADMQKIGDQQAALTKSSGEISRLNGILSVQGQYLDNLLNIFNHVASMTGASTGNYNDLKTQALDSISLLDTKKDSKLTYQLLKSGKISRSSKQVVEELHRLAETGKQIRSSSMKSEKEYGKIVYQIKEDSKAAEAGS
ncbi:MAG: hypothetical protein VXZ35_03120, partial [Pseudomonadota bacterium]|nr:hypothetical protein [Pseudomonadota bacterium]